MQCFKLVWYISPQGLKQSENVLQVNMSHEEEAKKKHVLRKFLLQIFDFSNNFFHTLFFFLWASIAYKVQLRENPLLV